MKNKKYSFMLVVILLMSFVLTGCSGNISIDEAQLKQDANDTLDEFFEGMVNSNLITIDGALSSNFIYTSGDSMNKQEFLNMIEYILLVEGANFIEMDLNHRVNEVISSTKIKISGSLYTEGSDTGGHDYTDNYPAQFIVEKESNEWKITKWIDE